MPHADSEPVSIVTYDPSWLGKFDTEQELIESTLGDWITGGVHHVGSTAVPGLAAKPIVDIMIGVEDLERSKACIELMEGIGYCYYPHRVEMMHWFCKPSPEMREFHAYLMEPSHPQWHARLAFRDYLTANPKAASDYEELKRQLAKQFPNDREAYTDAKAQFVEEVVKKASRAS